MVVGAARVVPAVARRVRRVVEVSILMGWLVFWEVWTVMTGRLFGCCLGVEMIV